VAIELAQQAADLLSDETVTASLSPDDISLIAGDARQAVQNAIDSVRSTWAAEMERQQFSDVDRPGVSAGD
jgi:hypothetical protein